MTIPFKVKLLTKTAKAPERATNGDLWDLFANDFDNSLFEKVKDKTKTIISDNSCELTPQARVLVKTGISIELPKQYENNLWLFIQEIGVKAYAVADIRPRSGLALKHGITVLNSPGTIDNSYRKEIGIILYNAGNSPYIIKKGDKIAQMLIRPLFLSSMEIVEDIAETGRGNYGSTGN